MKNTFSNNIISVHKQRGEMWLQQLPAFLEERANELSLVLHPPFADLTYHYTCPVRLNDGSNAVLKCTVPNSEFERDVNALLCFNNKTSITVLKHNINQGWILIEQCTPGTNLQDTSDEQSIAIITNLIANRLSEPSSNHCYEFPTVGRWLDRLDKPIANTLLDKHVKNCQHIKQDLLADQFTPLLLHGDLHHGNVLSAQREPYLMIDPKGVVGEALYELTPMMYNPITDLVNMSSDTALRKRLQRRLDIILDNITIDNKRLWYWCYVQACLAMCWFIDDDINKQAQSMLHLCEQFKQLI